MTAERGVKVAAPRGELPASDQGKSAALVIVGLLGESAFELPDGTSGGCWPEKAAEEDGFCERWPVGLVPYL